MRIISKLILIVLFFAGLSFSQDKNLQNIKQNFENFDFHSVINLTKEFLSEEKNINDKTLIDLYTMEAVSYYSLSDLDSARTVFIDLLKINKNHELDSMEVSPKIISFYKNVKDEYNKILEENVKPVQKIDTVLVKSKPEIIYNNSNLKSTMFRSIILPGWGHFYINENSKGWIFGTLSLAALGGSVYYYINTGSKEKVYLNESNPVLINKKYDDYNSSYKMRNVLIISYVAIWLYTQIDLLFFTDENSFNLNSGKISLNNFKYLPGFSSISISIPF